MGNDKFPEVLFLRLKLFAMTKSKSKNVVDPTLAELRNSAKHASTINQHRKGKEVIGASFSAIQGGIDNHTGDTPVKRDLRDMILAGRHSAPHDGRKVSVELTNDQLRRELALVKEDLKDLQRKHLRAQRISKDEMMERGRRPMTNPPLRNGDWKSYATGDFKVRFPREKSREGWSNRQRVDVDSSSSDEEWRERCTKRQDLGETSKRRFQEKSDLRRKLEVIHHSDHPDRLEGVWG